MDKQKIQEIIAQGRIRNLSDEQIAEQVLQALEEEEKHGKKGRTKQEVDSVGN